MMYALKNILLPKIRICLFLFLGLNICAQNDTIYLSDTIISSVRILGEDEDFLKYSFIEEDKKKIMFVSLAEIDRIVFENEKIEIFCDLISRKKFLGTDETIAINYGKRDDVWVDEKIYTLITKDLKKYNSIIDALNYMGSEGWKTINSYSTSRESYTIEHYILKKEITK